MDEPDKAGWSMSGGDAVVCPECGGLANQLLPSSPGDVIWRCLTCGVKWLSWIDKPLENDRGKAEERESAQGKEAPQAAAGPSSGYGA